MGLQIPPVIKNSFDPVGSYQRGQAGALAIDAQKMVNQEGHQSKDMDNAQWLLGATKKMEEWEQAGVPRDQWMPMIFQAADDRDMPLVEGLEESSPDWRNLPPGGLLQNIQQLRRFAEMQLSGQPMPVIPMATDVAGFQRDTRTGRRPPGFADAVAPGPTPTTKQRDYQAGLEDPAYAQYLKDNPSGININLDPGDKKESELMAGSRVTAYGEVRTAANAGIGTMETIDQMRLFDFEGGPGTDFKNQARRFVMAIGGSEFVNVDEVNSAAGFTGLAYREFLNIMSTQKGPQTDNDFLRIKQTFATVTDPILAREFLMDSAYATAARKQEQFIFYDDYYETNNESLKGVEKAWRDFKAVTPLLSDAIRNPETGLPTFYIDFKSKMQIANPGASDEQIIQKWRELTQGKR